MVKPRKREHEVNQKEPSEEEIEKFAAGADNGHIEKDSLDPDAPRKFKAIRVPFNEYEFRKLEKLATKTRRTKLNLIRWLITNKAEKL